MNVLAYLLSAPLSSLPEVSSHSRTARILFGNRTIEEGDEEHLQRFSGILLGLGKGAWALSLAHGSSQRH
jgi:hypothetical protein